ncbi:MAG TPA: NYN domain-containing protein, partial [Thermoanaerobaculia bacterium]|nr:NYN domain-containing protein [Thermoanaerobaculia bacterium]
MSPWWLRPPGDEPEEAPEAAPRPADGEAQPASIADLMKASAEEAAAEPEEEEEEEGAEPAGEPGGNGEEAPRRKRRRRRRRRAAAAAEGESAKSAHSTAEEEDEEDEDDRDDYESVARDILESLPVAASRRASTEPEERKIALFCDLENVALGVRDSEVKRFEIHLVLERLLEKGKIIVKRAYADWERYSEFKIAFHEAAIELIDIPQRRYTGKNSADIKMVVDAMDLCYAKEHLDTFVVLSGDSDFSPLVSKLKENNKYVIGIGVKNSSSNLLVDNCDEFIYYEDVWRDRVKGPEITGLTKKKAEV